MNTCLIDGLGHDTAQGIDFLDQMALAYAAYGRVAGHLADGVGVLCKDERLAAEAGGGESGLDAGMAGAEEWDAELEWIPDVDDDPDLQIYGERAAP